MKLRTLVRLLDENEGKILSINLTKTGAEELCEDAKGLYQPAWRPGPETVNPWWIGTIMGVRVFKEQPEC